ncbi:MAG: hypothetical protein RL739_2656 [Pseudomonadota bacterium]|jgi:hypothetical protein
MQGSHGLNSSKLFTLGSEAGARVEAILGRGLGRCLTGSCKKRITLCLGLLPGAQRVGARPAQAQKSPDQRGFWMRTGAIRP